MVRSRDNAVVSDRWPYRRALAVVAAIGLVAAVASLCFFTVDSADYAIVTDFGKPTQVITAPGLRFKHPLQSVRTFDRRLFVYASPPSEFLTIEKTPVVASGTILWSAARLGGDIAWSRVSGRLPHPPGGMPLSPRPPAGVALWHRGTTASKSST